MICAQLILKSILDFTKRAELSEACKMCFDALNETQRHNQSLKKLDMFKMSSTNFYTSLTLNYNIRLRKVNAELIYVKLK